MKQLLLLIIGFAISAQLIAQVPKKIVVEHFTNTECSVCASQNPGFYTNLKAQTNVFHLAIHPSSPYASCKLNQHNKTENDARTNYYGVYGSTPKIVIQGTVISGSISSSSIFNPYKNQTSPASIRIDQTKFNTDSIRARVIIKTETTHSLGNLKLFVALAEDTVDYTGGNGEKKHFDVFRKSLSGTSGTAVTLPSKVGDSIVITLSSKSNPAWNFARIYTLVILQQEADKKVIQSEAVSAKSNVIPTDISNKELFQVKLFPNPTKDHLQIEISELEKSKLFIYDIKGALIQKTAFQKSVKIDLSFLSPGLYFLRIENSKGSIIKNVVKN